MEYKGHLPCNIICVAGISTQSTHVELIQLRFYNYIKFTNRYKISSKNVKVYLHRLFFICIRNSRFFELIFISVFSLTSVINNERLQQINQNRLFASEILWSRVWHISNFGNITCVFRVLLTILRKNHQFNIHFLQEKN